ncbi:Glucose-induced degradation protein [Paramyrothecium foliicola]|nr:Glucose-induced degradation protein [Paramyrothecium foliicola]
MPTPSSDPAPNPAPQITHPSSSCPDDLQHPLRQSRPEALVVDSGNPDEMEVQHELVLGDASSPERSASAEPLSRDTTMSPRPQSSVTLSTSPPPSGHDTEAVKPPQERMVEDMTCQENLTKAQRIPNCNRNSPSHEVQPYDSRISEDDYILPSMGPEYSSMRSLAVSPSSFLRPGSRFHGTQQSERQVYDVQVEIKHVDMRESFLCGYLRIQGLTDDHPTLTTFFEGEIIGSKYNFFTQHEDWGANTKVDLNHWSKFSAFRPFAKLARKGTITIPDVAQKENIFMRWKEHFLVPDHRVRTISGASFEGFYYICFNQIKGEVSGIYFHSKSEK